MLPNIPTRGHILPVRQMRAVLSADQYATTIFNSYVKLVDIARYAKTEPTEEDAENVECAVYALTALYVTPHFFPSVWFMVALDFWIWSSWAVTDWILYRMDLWRTRRKADGSSRQESGLTRKGSLAIPSPT